MPSATASTPALLNAERGLNLLLNDDLTGARSALESHNDPYALAGMGICEFLTAAVGLEDERLQKASEALSQAEKSATKAKSTAEAEPGQWWTQPGLELEVIIADVTAAQSLLHLLGDSYFEYAKAIYKLNSAYKYFSAIYKAVFVQEVKPDSSIENIVADLNERYRNASTAHKLKHQHRSTLGKLKSLAPRISSTSDLHAPVSNTSLSTGGASLPVSVNASTNASVSNSPPNGLTGTPSPEWTKSPVMSFIVSGGAFGHGLFELVFALMPPKARKMFSWLGYGAGDRKRALKLLELTASTGTDIHASFSALVLISYYALILLMSGWQADRAGLLKAYSDTLERELQKHPKGTLWLLNKAKLMRYSGDVDGAYTLLQQALSGPSTFRQAVSTLQFELCWVLLSKCQYAEAASAFLKMVELNSWSHSTYYAFAAGCLRELPHRTDAQDAQMAELYAKIPTSMNKKRFMGQPPSSEIYLEKRIKFYTVKTARWKSEGWSAKDAEWWDTVRISTALELSLYWNQFTHYPEGSLRELIGRLEGLRAQEPPELDTPEEVALCHTILGACYSALKDLEKARKYLELAEDASSSGLNEAYTYLGALSRLHLARLACQEADATAGQNDREVWRKKLQYGEGKLDEVFAQTAYDMNGRVESRGQMLRVEIAEKKARLGL